MRRRERRWASDAATNANVLSSIKSSALDMGWTSTVATMRRATRGQDTSLQLQLGAVLKNDVEKYYWEVTCLSPMERHPAPGLGFRYAIRYHAPGGPLVEVLGTSSSAGGRHGTRHKKLKQSAEELAQSLKGALAISRWRGWHNQTKTSKDQHSPSVANASTRA